MTYNVFSGMLNPTQYQSHSVKTELGQKAGSYLPYTTELGCGGKQCVVHGGKSLL